MPAMTFLEIVQRSYRESGVGGSTGPASVENQTGRNLDFVRWAQDAYNIIQALPEALNFRWRKESLPLVAGKAVYDPIIDWGIVGGVKQWAKDGAYIYRPAEGPAARLWLGYLEWPLFRQLPVPIVPGFANVFTRQPDQKIQFFPQPEQNYTAVMEFYMNPETLTANGQIPEMPPELHMMIVWRAVMLYANFNKDWSRHDTAEEEYERLRDTLTIDHSGDVIQAGPLA